MAGGRGGGNNDTWVGDYLGYRRSGDRGREVKIGITERNNQNRLRGTGK